MSTTYHPFLEDIFDTRDHLDGNESEEPDTSDEESDNEENNLTRNPEDIEMDIDDNAEEEDDHWSIKVRQVLEFMDQQSVKLVDFLDALSWGSRACTLDPKIRSERTTFLHSPQLIQILERWAKPPRPPKSKKRRPEGASTALKEFAINYVQNIANDELNALAPDLCSPPSQDVDETVLVGTTMNSLAGAIQKRAPLLWKTFQTIASRPSQVKRNTKKRPDNVIITTICMLAYSRSHHNCLFPKLLAMYLKFKGISAKGFDLLHALRLTMSHKWTCNSVERISKSCMKDVKEKMNTHPWLISYDNVNIPFRVFSQRVDNQSEFGNGTAATIYIKPDATPMSPEAPQNLRKKRAEGMKNPLTELDILNLVDESHPRIQQQAAYHILRFLLESPEFDFKTYADKDSDALKPPPPVNQLPSGTDHITLQYLLGTVNIPEASYDDNDKLINEWFRQMGWGDPGKQMVIAMKKIVFWIGDQLTMDRLRGLFQFRAEDLNSFERLDFSTFVFGWLHLQMAFANSLHKQYLGTNQGRGLRQSFNLLNKKGLMQTSTKGPFHHNLEEALYHIAEAHILEDWLLMGKVKKIEDLRNLPAEELVKLAEDLLCKRASSEAMDIINIKPEEKHDEQLLQVMMWNRDVLQYIVLDQAIRQGDVGLMEFLLPHLLLRFTGGGNGNYAGEIIELLQGLHREWDEETCDFVRRHCWLVNMTGKPDGFLAIDKAQEHNIKDIKVTYRSEGPNVKWDFMKKLHPAIPRIRLIAKHVENEFGTYKRGLKHTAPQKDADVKKLRESYRMSCYHNYEAGRTIKHKDDKAEDYIFKGASKYQAGEALTKWVHSRTFARSTAERWEHLAADGSEDEDEGGF